MKRHILATGYFDNSAEGYIVRLGIRSGYHLITIPKRLCAKENDDCQIISPKYHLILEEVDEAQERSRHEPKVEE